MRVFKPMVRDVAFFFRDLKQRWFQFWDADRFGHAPHWAARLKRADNRIKRVRLARPGVFWAVVLGIIPLVAIVLAIFISGTAAGLWATYHANREDIAPLATFVTAIGVITAAVIALMRHFAQTDADRQRRINESFAKAVEQLGSDKLEVRVGAIFALERLSKESSDDYWTIMEVLTAFVRDRLKYTAIVARLSERSYFLWLQAGCPEGRSEEFWLDAVRLEGAAEPPTDVAAIFTVIRRRSHENRQGELGRDWRFDLNGTYLRNADLWGMHLEGSYLFGAHLEGAYLYGAYLENANLGGVHLEGADLVQARLEGAYLFGAHLERANLREARLETAYLVGASLDGANLGGAHLEGANLRGVHLEGADLNEAHLDGTLLGGAHLGRADLRFARRRRATYSPNSRKG
jgi:hypothetical protein